MSVETNRVIGASAVTTFGIMTLYYTGVEKTAPPIKVYLGLSTAFLGISIMTDLGGEAIAMPFCILIMVVVLVERGPEVLGFVNKRGGSSKSKTRRANTRNRKTYGAKAGDYRFESAESADAAERATEQADNPFPYFTKFLKTERG